MTHKLHKMALKKLKSINTFRVSSKKRKKIGNLTRIEYEHVLIPMGDFTLCVSGTIENYHGNNIIETSRDLMITVWDEENDELLKLTSGQLFDYKNEATRLMKTEVI